MSSLIIIIHLSYFISMFQSSDIILPQHDPWRSEKYALKRITISFGHQSYSFVINTFGYYDPPQLTLLQTRTSPIQLHFKNNGMCQDSSHGQFIQLKIEYEIMNCQSPQTLNLNTSYFLKFQDNPNGMPRLLSHVIKYGSSSKRIMGHGEVSFVDNLFVSSNQCYNEEPNELWIDVDLYGDPSKDKVPQDRFDLVLTAAAQQKFRFVVDIVSSIIPNSSEGTIRHNRKRKSGKTGNKVKQI